MADDTPVPFGYKMGWLAISSTDRDGVVAALHLVNPREVTWQTGIDAVYRSGYSLLGILANTSHKVFVSPPVSGWTLVVSDWVAGTGEEDGMREVEQLITPLSTQFGEVQAFATYRVIGYEHWVLARNGALVRSFASGEDGVFESGDPTAVELTFSWYPLPLPRDEEDEDTETTSLDEEGGWPNEEAVMKVAEAWSINPTELSPTTPRTGYGILSTAPVPRQMRRNPEAIPHRRPWWRFW